VDLRFEEGVRNAILAEVEGEPGAMPLLQYALLELWNRRRGRWLCYEEYEALGGLREALGHTAEQCYEHLLPEEQAQVRNIFLRLTRVDEGAVSGKQQRYTRLRVELEALPSGEGDSAVTKRLVNKLADERLVTTSRNLSTGKEVLEVAHEAIFEHWPRLQNWLNENLEDLQVLAQIRQAEQEWNKHRQDKKERDNYLVHRGERLKKAQQLAQPPSFLNKLEQEYVSTCLEREKRARLRMILGGCAAAAFVLVVSWVAWEQVQENKVENWDGSTKISEGLLKRAVSRAKKDEQRAQKNREEEQARRNKDEENIKEVLHDYQKLLRYSVKYPDTVQPWAEKSLAKIISLYRLPQLEQDLKNQQFGQLAGTKLQDYENQFTKGALRTTYAILMRELGAKADTNGDGKINNLEEARQLPCDTLKEIEAIWRKSTENRCGFYGENSFYQASRCTQLNGRTLTETVFFVTYDPIIERLKSCNVVPKAADPYQ
jgi:HD superfamily phosphohydrolase